MYVHTSTMRISQLLSILLYSCCYSQFVTSQVIIQPPQNQTGCEGGTVNFVCVVMFTSGPLGPASWFGSSRRPGYSLTDDSNGRSAPANVTNVLTVPNVSIRDNGDDFICEQQGINAMSFTAFLTVIVLPPTIAPTLNEVIPSSSTSCTVIWTINNTNYDIILILTNLLTGEINIVTVTEYTVNTNIYNVTERLNGVDNYNVSVATINACGRMMSDTVTVYALPTTAPMNIRFPQDDITSESFVVQWDEVNDFFPVTYTVRWYRGDDEGGMASVTGPRFTVTGLTNNTIYNVTVVAINTCCGKGPVSDFAMVMTNNQPPTMPPPTTVTPTPTVTPVLQSCTITSPSANTIRVSCELLETFTRISVTISSNSCTCSQPITMVDDNPITVSDLPIGVYTVEVTAVNSNDMNNRIVEMITVFNKSTATDESDSSSLSTGAAVAITCVISVLVSVTVTAIVTSVIMYVLMKRKNESAPQDNINKVLYEEVISPSRASKNDVELQHNPAYGTGHKVVMDTNPAYKSYK